MTDTSPFRAPEPGVAPPDLLEAGLVVGSDGRARCFWGGSSPDYTAYHDAEWGRPVLRDDALFERMCLEAFQSGLAWITILRKRESFRAAFAHFSIEKVAAFSDADATRLMADAGIVRNRMKIDAALHNARVAAELPDGLSALLWSYAPEPRPPRPRTRADVPAVTAESTAMAKDLKKRGFRFVGPTTAYALMQATGMVDDHVAGCWVPPIGHPGAA
jgi:DNA-3-methyladenine glycosylase I